MLTTLRDPHTQQILACCEWHLVEPTWRDGYLTTALCPDGRYVWIEQYELSRGASMSQCVRQIIEHIATRCPWTVAVYWQREDKLVPVRHQFTRAQVLRFAQKGVCV